MTLDPDHGVTQADRDPAIGQACATHRATNMTADSPRTGIISTPPPPVLTVEGQRDRMVRPTNAAVVVEIHPAVGKRQDPTDPERRRAQLTVDLTRPLSAKIQGMESLGFHTNPLLHHIEMIGVPPEVVPPDLRPLRTNRPRVIQPATKPRERTARASHGDYETETRHSSRSQSRNRDPRARYDHRRKSVPPPHDRDYPRRNGNRRDGDYDDTGRSPRRAGDDHPPSITHPKCAECTPHLFPSVKPTFLRGDWLCVLGHHSFTRLTKVIVRRAGGGELHRSVCNARHRCHDR